MTASGYINNFLYFTVREAHAKGPGDVIYCSGVNIARFTPVTGGRHGLSSNPVIRGLQRINHGVRGLALSRGATPEAMRGNDCAGIAPTREAWYMELLLIAHCPESLAGEIIQFCVANFIEKITSICMLRDFRMPQTLPSPEELESFLDSLGRGEGRG